MSIARRVLMGMSPPVGAPPGLAPDLVQPVVAPGFVNSTPTYQMTLTGVTPGSTLVAVYPVRDTAGRTLLGLSDSVNGEYTIVHQDTHTSDDNLWLYSGYVQSSLGDNVTVTITWDGSVAIADGAFFELTNGAVVERDNFSNPAGAPPRYCAPVGGIDSGGNPAFGIGFIHASGNADHLPKADWTQVGLSGRRSDVYYRKEDVEFIAERCDIQPAITSRVELGGLLFVR